MLTTIYTTIGLSVLLHGVTAAPLARRYAGWIAAHPRHRDLQVESGAAHEVRWRLRDPVNDGVPESPPAPNVGA
jgi:hypothetical protein